ncbi:electron transfer flavoprotein subunit alpha/FixB family protein [Raineyella sp. W15-4]|uniref:electron transfer flavoprotein subunit alpha/FixB family protein n=1 Tax=Raineyella sp. W15-4 TaxID=3081651 RepID=UPI0029541E25|nr:electron transfer flavoprotein subunit alpha/FixB family protein [Raineyella sp. W15-4]WOQ18047.1 electron transfer flavoprotein subunit alpha/FixB family protein [Raineyella sp. W15-4]
MATAFAFIELDERGQVTADAAEVVAGATRLGEPIAVVATDGDPAPVLARLGQVGATDVVIAHHPLATPATAVPAAAALLAAAADAATPPRAVVLPHTRCGREVAAHVALGLDGGLLTDVVDLVGGPEIRTTQAVLGGGWTTVAAVLSGPAVITVRPGSLPEVLPPAQPRVTRVRIDPDPRLIEEVQGVAPYAGVTSRPALRSASTVVAGGRGMASAGGFSLVERLADELGAAVGASRAAVDAGLAPRSAQVGQSGTTVSPDLYLALGISGAMQHLAGMSGAGTVVAVDLDPAAPIFDIADFGVVGDVTTVVPALIEALRSRRDGAR